MKISPIGPVYPHLGGITHHKSMLASALIYHHHTVNIVSFQGQYPGWPYPGKSDKDPSRQPIHTPAEFILDPFSTWTWEQTVDHINQFHPDLVVTQWWTTFWALHLSFLNARLSRTGIKVVYLFQYVTPYEPMPWDRWLAKLALKKSGDFIIHIQAESLRLIHLVPDANIDFCHIPPFSDLVQKVVPPGISRKELNISENEKVFLFFGFVRPFRKLLFFLDAFKVRQEKEWQTRLLIAGEFRGDKSSYLKKIKAMGLSSRISIIDRYIPNERLPVIFGVADCLVAPYTGGTQSVIPSTSLAFGLPIIMTAQIAANTSEGYQKTINVIATQDANE